MKTSKQQLRLKFAGLVVGLVLFGWVANNAIDQSQSVDWGALSTFDLVIASLIVLIAHGLRCLAWTIGARQLTPNLGWMEGISIYSVTFLARYVPGKIWQIGGLSALARKKGADPVHIAAYSLVFMVAYQLLGAITLLVVYFFRDNETVVLLTLLFIPLVALCFALLYHFSGSRLAALLPKKVELVINQSLGQPLGSIFVNLMLLGLVWFLLASCAYTLVGGFAPDWGGGWGFSTVAVIAGLIAGFLVLIAPSGAGVRESAIALGLTEIGVSPMTSIAIVIALRIVMTLGELLWAALGMLLIWRKTSP